VRVTPDRFVLLLDMWGAYVFCGGIFSSVVILGLWVPKGQDQGRAHGPHGRALQGPVTVG